MESRTLTNLSTFNNLGMNEFEIIAFSKEDDSLVVRAHQGYDQHFRAEIKFAWVGYIACPVYFFDVRLRLATEKEIARIGPHKNASTLYCFEDTLATKREQVDTFFIAANAIEITVYYGGDNLDEVIGRAEDPPIL